MKKPMISKIGLLQFLLVAAVLYQTAILWAQIDVQKDLRETADKSTTGNETETEAKQDGGITGPELIELYKEYPQTKLDEGFYYQDIYTGSGREVADGHVVYVMARGFDANGAELRLGSDNHSHPDDVSSDHGHGIHAYAGRWFVYGYGGGNLTMGTEAMNKRLFEAMAGMRENSKRLIYIAADKAYGKQGYTGHDFKVKPDTDLLIEISLIRVRFVESPEDRGLN